MFKKLKKFNFKFKFKLPYQKDILIFDNQGSEEILKYIIEEKYEYYIYDTKKINIYLNIYFLFIFFKNILDKEIKASFIKKLYIIYIKSEIELINPKLVITYNDDNAIYHYIIPFLDNIKCMALQNGLRERFIRNRIKHQINHDYLYCFGENDIVKNRLDSWTSKQIIPIGSLRAGIAKSKFSNIQKLYDICILSEYEPRDKNSLDNHHWNDYWITLTEIMSQIQKNTDFNIIVARNGHGGNKEINYLRTMFNQSTCYSNPDKEFDSYKAILQSKLTIGFCSTLLAEAISLNSRVLQLNTSNSNLYFDFDEIFIHHYENNSNLIDKIRQLLDMSYDDYHSKINDFIPYYMNIDNQNLPQDYIKNQLTKMFTETQRC